MDIAKIRKKRKEKKKTVKKKTVKKKTVKKEQKKGSEDPSPETTNASLEETSERIDDTVEKGADKSVEVQEEPVIQQEIVEEGDEEEPENLVEFLVFTLSDEYYGFRLFDLQEVLKEQFLTYVPQMPGFVTGITSLRGQIIPVLDLKKRLSIKNETQTQGKNQIAVIKGKEGPVGILVDKVVGVRRVEEDNVKEAPSHLDETQMRFIDSVIRDGEIFISLLSVQEVVDFEPLPMKGSTHEKA